MQYQHLSTKIAPLAGRKILVTRAAHQASKLTQGLESAGAEVIELPLIEILPPVSWEVFDKIFAQAQNYNWLLFASVNAVQFTTARLSQTGQLEGIKSQLTVATVGQSTTQAAKAAGFTVGFHPAQFSGVKLVQQFPGFPELNSVKMIWPRTDIGPKYVADELRKAGAQVDTVICYRTAPPQNQEEVSKKLAALLLAKGIDVVTLNSAQTARNFFELSKLGLDSLRKDSSSGERTNSDTSQLQATPAQLQALLAPITIASIGPETSAVAKQLLGRVDIEAETHSIAGLIEELTRSLGS